MDVIAFKEKLHTKCVVDTKRACFVALHFTGRQCTTRKIKSSYSLTKLEKLISHYIKPLFFVIETSQNLDIPIGHNSMEQTSSLPSNAFAIL